MDKLRRWLIDIDNNEIGKLYKGVFDYDEIGFEGALIGEMCVAEPVVQSCNLNEDISIEGYVRQVHSRDLASIEEIPDKFCMDFYNGLMQRFIDENKWETCERLRNYKEEKRKAVVGYSMEFLRLRQRETLKRLTDACCVEECHLKISESMDIMERYRLELGLGEEMMGSDELRRYAFFRRFFSYNNFRYTLSGKELVARLFYLYFYESDGEWIMKWFTEYSMLLYIQMEMDDLNNSKKEALRNIKTFDPFAVLEFVDALGEFASDREEVRRKWEMLISRREELVMRYHDFDRGCFDRKDMRDLYDRRFVISTLGFMKKQGWYKGTKKQLALSFPNFGMGVDTLEKYMGVLFPSLHVYQSSIDLIRSIVGEAKK